MTGKMGRITDAGMRRCRVGMEEPMARPFLTTHWKNIVLVNYRVPPELLLPHVPAGSELDTPDDDPSLHLLSLVALEFFGMRVRGIPFPTARNFPEVNLRFYVRRGPMRAAVFLREFVPSRLVVLGARLLYNQPYFLARISHQVDVHGDRVSVETTFAHRKHRGVIRVRARNEPFIPPEGSQAHFLKEHYWGFDRHRSGHSFRYRVTHPVWRTYRIDDAEVRISPGLLLGGAWQQVEWPAALHSVVFAEGSEAAIYPAEPLTAGEAALEALPVVDSGARGGAAPTAGETGRGG